MSFTKHHHRESL